MAKHLEIARSRANRLTIGQILAWADHHRRGTGDWPKIASGGVINARGEKWSAIYKALRNGNRGLPGGSSLAQLLHERRGYRHPLRLPRLREGQILAWADAHHKRTGRWPTDRSGPVHGVFGESWAAVQSALFAGLRGLPGNDTLPRLLLRRRGVRYNLAAPRLTISKILAWADAHRRRTSRWPVIMSGAIRKVRGETWAKINAALVAGGRGLQAGTSLARLLATRRGARSPGNVPELSMRRILGWADQHHRRTGRWPNASSDLIPGSGGETWNAVDNALRKGTRGLSGGSSLARLLHFKRGVYNVKQLPRLTVRQILAWADLHKRRTGTWPTRGGGGPVIGAPSETWHRVNAALVVGLRGLPGGSSLARFLQKHRGVRNPKRLPRLRPAAILAWADVHYARTGTWPGNHSGPVLEVPGETWQNVDAALRKGIRGLPPGGSLPRLLAKHRGHRNRKALPPLTHEEIIQWARRHTHRTGSTPTGRSGPVVDAPGETWSGISVALNHGIRGLRGRETLARLLARNGIDTN